MHLAHHYSILHLTERQIDPEVIETYIDIITVGAIHSTQDIAKNTVPNCGLLIVGAKYTGCLATQLKLTHYF